MVTCSPPGRWLLMGSGRRCGFCGAPWSTLETSFLWFLLSLILPQMVDQLVAVLARYDMPLADQVIEVPKVSCPPSSRCARAVLWTPQTVEQLVDVPTIVSFSLLQLILEQNVGIPVPRGKGRLAGPQGFLPEQSSPSTVEQIIDIPAPGRGVQRGLQGFSQERSSTACTTEQNVDIPVPGSGLHDFPVPGSSCSSAVSRDVRGEGFFFSHFSKVKKRCDTTSALWVGTASALEPMDAGSL